MAPSSSSRGRRGSRSSRPERWAALIRGCGTPRYRSRRRAWRRASTGCAAPDVKPQNILLERDGRARLADFGSARMDGDATITRTGGMVGTLAYMGPETVAGRRGDARADVFALGMTLFYAAAGRLPDRPSPHLPLPPSASGYTPIALGTDVPTWLSHVIAGQRQQTRPIAIPRPRRSPTRSRIAMRGRRQRWPRCHAAGACSVVAWTSSGLACARRARARRR